MRLSHITTEYPTGVPFVTTGGMVWAFLILVSSTTIWDDNIQGACVAGVSLAMDAFFQHAIHRVHVRHHQRAGTHA